jgi:hypothetical protein
MYLSRYNLGWFCHKEKEKEGRERKEKEMGENKELEESNKMDLNKI